MTQFRNFRESKLVFHHINLFFIVLSTFFSIHQNFNITVFIVDEHSTFLHVILPAGILFCGKILKQILPFPSYRKNFIMQPSRRTYIIHAGINNSELMNRFFRWVGLCEANIVSYTLAWKKKHYFKLKHTPFWN